MSRARAGASASALLCAAGWTGLIAAGAAPQAVMAQNDQAQASERIIVTARRREESFIELPASITAFTASDIENAGITSARDFIALTPNVTLVESQNAGTSFVTIRGISQARNSEPSVAVVIDGVQQTNPSQFTQELVDIQQIEVLRGPQGAIYGRNAIGGAINITSRAPTDAWEATVKAGVDNGFGYNLLARASGPIGDTVGFAGGVSWRDTEGYLENEFLDEKADDLQNLAGRGRLIFQPNDQWTIDLRGAFDQLETRALYFVIDFGNDVNNTDIPIRTNNLGLNERDIYGASAQIQHESDLGVFASTTAWDSLEEILTGDQFDFKPIPESLFFNLFGEDWTQSQYLDVENVSQEFRFTSPDDRRVRYIVGAYAVTTDRYISTGNMADTGNGIIPVYREPSTNPLNPQRTFLADSQDNTAWAVFGDLTMDVGERWELSFAGRYDEDEREQTTLTPPAFLVGLPQATSGEVRTVTFDEFQPKVTARYSVNENFSVYGGYSRGFRSGGFNQSGVADAAIAAGILGVDDIFEAEVADTYEAGFKAQGYDGRLNVNGAAYHTTSENPYFFVFLASNSTQNLGNIEEVEYVGFELDATARLTDELSINFGAGMTDSEITDFADPSVIGNEAPLVSKYTLNLGAEYVVAVARDFDLRARVDWRRIGDTYWEPYNVTKRDPVDLVDVRLALEHGSWSLAAWSKNAFDEEYNAEFSPGGFLWKGMPQRYGLELTRRF